MGHDGQRGERREVELKIRLRSQQDFLALLRAAGGEVSPPVTQENHFFDTADQALNRAKLACRLRREAGRFTLTLKGPTQATAGGLVSDRREEEIELGAGVAAAVLAQELQPLVAMREAPGMDESRRALIGEIETHTGGASLVRLGAFENERTRVAATLDLGRGPEPFTLEFDRTTFPGGKVEYEVELELSRGEDPAAAERALASLCAAARVEGEPAPSKAKRFFAALARRGG